MRVIFRIGALLYACPHAVAFRIKKHATAGISTREGDENNLAARYLPEEEFCGYTPDELPPVPPMWEDVLHAATSNNACQHLGEWAHAYGKELNIKTSLNIVGAAGSVLGVAGGAGQLATHANHATKAVANVAGNIADGWGVIDATLETGEVLQDAVFDAEHEFDEIRAQHVSDADTAWTYFKRSQMAVGLIILGGTVIAGSGGAATPWVVAGAASGVLGGATAALDQVGIEQDREGFVSFMCHYDHYCTERGHNVDIAPILNSNVRLSVRKGPNPAVMMMPVPQLLIPRRKLMPIPLIHAPRGGLDPWQAYLPHVHPSAVSLVVPFTHVDVQAPNMRLRGGEYIKFTSNGKEYVVQVPLGVWPGQFFRVRIA